MLYRRRSLFTTIFVTTNIVLASQTAFAQFDPFADLTKATVNGTLGSFNDAQVVEVPRFKEIPVPKDLSPIETCEASGDNRCKATLKNIDANEEFNRVLRNSPCDPRELTPDQARKCIQESWQQEFSEASKGAFEHARCEFNVSSEKNIAATMACSAKSGLQEVLKVQSEGARLSQCELGDINKLNPRSGCLARELRSVAKQRAKLAGHDIRVENCMRSKRPGQCLERRDRRTMKADLDGYFPDIGCSAPRDSSAKSLAKYLQCAVSNMAGEGGLDLSGITEYLNQAGSDAPQEEIQALAQNFVNQGSRSRSSRSAAPSISFQMRAPSLCAGRRTTVNWYLQIGTSPVINVFLGSGGNDVIAGTDDNDILIGFGGSDVLCGRDKRDYLFGDLIFPFGAAAGDDEIYGDKGSDIAFGGDGNDKLFGSDGIDYLLGGRGNDTILGGNDNDAIYGSEGADKLVGESGNDRILGGHDDDVILAGPGEDYVLAGLGNDMVDGGTDRDSLYGQDGDDRLHGGDGSDLVFGGFGNDLAHGQAGNDFWISGGPGDDRVRGGQGDDNIVAGDDGNDDVAGQDGSDQYVAGGPGNDKVSGGPGNDNLFGDDGNDSLQGNAGEDEVYGGQGNDSINGGSGADYLEGNDGDDQIFGAQGNDTIEAGLGNDSVDGGEGNDMIYGGLGMDTLVGHFGNDRIDGGVGADVIDGQEGSDWIFGQNGDDSIYGGASVDFIFGDANNDQIFGGDSIDFIYGGSGDDLLFGQSNDDYLSCGADNDYANAGGSPFDYCDPYQCEIRVGC